MKSCNASTSENGNKKVLSLFLWDLLFIFREKNTHNSVSEAIIGSHCGKPVLTEAGKPFLKGSGELGLLGRPALIAAQTKTGRTLVDEWEKRALMCIERGDGAVLVELRSPLWGLMWRLQSVPRHGEGDCYSFPLLPSVKPQQLQAGVISLVTVVCRRLCSN